MNRFPILLGILISCVSFSKSFSTGIIGDAVSVEKNTEKQVEVIGQHRYNIDNITEGEALRKAKEDARKKALQKANVSEVISSHQALSKSEEGEVIREYFLSLFTVSQNAVFENIQFTSLETEKARSILPTVPFTLLRLKARDTSRRLIP